MTVAGAFVDFYSHVFKVLSADATVSAAVPAENLRPSNDPIEPAAGAVVYYSWTNAAWDPRRSRGRGTFNITVASAKGKTDAAQVLEAVRAALTPRALRDADTKVVAHKFRENEAMDDEGVGASERFEASTSYDVRLVQA